MVEAYTKSPLTFEQQLQQLKDRGLIIDDDDLALFHLKTISYYRLSAYWHPFRKIEQDGVLSDDFEEGTQFTEVIRLYEFDRRLRLLVMDAIERIEVYARTLFTYQIGHRYGTFGHTKAANFHPNFNHAPWLEKSHCINLRKMPPNLKMCLYPTIKTNTLVSLHCQSGW